jgi:hypothetical protein
MEYYTKGGKPVEGGGIFVEQWRGLLGWGDHYFKQGRQATAGSDSKKRRNPSNLPNIAITNIGTKINRILTHKQYFLLLFFWY